MGRGLGSWMGLSWWRKSRDENPKSIVRSMELGQNLILRNLGNLGPGSLGEKRGTADEKNGEVCAHGLCFGVIRGA